MPETRQKLQLKGAAVSLYRASTTAPADPFNCSIIRGPRSNSSFFIYPLQFTIACDSRGIILRSFVYSLLIIEARVILSIWSIFFFFFYFSRSSKIYAYVDISRRSGARRPSPARRKREIRGDMSLVFTRKDPPVRGGDRFRRAKSTMSSDVLERERERERRREKKVIGEVRICVWLFPGNAARFIFIPRKTAPLLSSN